MTREPCGRQELCPECDELFSGTYSGDMHRTGEHHIFTGPDRRRCLTVDEMLAKDMSQDDRGVWRTASAAIKADRKGESAA